MRHSRYMRVVRGEVQKERLVLVRINERDRLRREDVRHVFVFPQRGAATGHVADAADAVDDGLVVPMAGVHLQQFGMIFAGWPISDRFAITHADGITTVSTNG